ncbi:hypothetical protein AGMMS50267_17940 [Spirochaetia bacterium]|nr:hypothetical protein AGMMS50267_17940 [Spirochaetia bacterium]
MLNSFLDTALTCSRIGEAFAGSVAEGAYGRLKAAYLCGVRRLLLSVNPR